MKLLLTALVSMFLLSLFFYVFIISPTTTGLKGCDTNFTNSLKNIGNIDDSEIRCSLLKESLSNYYSCEKKVEFLPYSVKITKTLTGLINPEYKNKSWENLVSKYCGN